MRAFSWKSLALIAAVPAVVGVVLPSLAELPAFRAIRQLGFGVLMAVAVGATVAGMAEPAGYATRNKDGESRRQQAARVYRSQKRVGLVMSALVFIPLLAFAAWTRRFEAMGGWFFVPIALISPVLYARDAQRAGRAVSKTRN